MEVLLAKPDCTCVYWAQWMGKPLGILTEDLHRKLLFNAMKLYQTMLPERRCAVSPDGAQGVELLAGGDQQRVGVPIWKLNGAARTVTVRLEPLPFHAGALQVFRIDAHHSSYLDDAASETLTACERYFADGEVVSWTGEVPDERLVFLSVARD